MTSLRDRARISNTLVCLLTGLQGVHTTVELRNDNVIWGRIISVKADMDTFLEEVTLTKVDGSHEYFDEFFVKGTQIRYVQIPDHINMRRAIERELNVTVSGVRGHNDKRRKRSIFKSSKEKKAILKAKVDAEVQKLREQLKIESSGGSAGHSSAANGISR